MLVTGKSRLKSVSNVLPNPFPLAASKWCSWKLMPTGCAGVCVSRFEQQEPQTEHQQHDRDGQRRYGNGLRPRAAGHSRHMILIQKDED